MLLIITLKPDDILFTDQGKVTLVYHSGISINFESYVQMFGISSVELKKKFLKSLLKRQKYIIYAKKDKTNAYKGISIVSRKNDIKNICKKVAFEDMKRYNFISMSCPNNKWNLNPSSEIYYLC